MKTKNKEKNKISDFYMAWNKNTEVLKKSSSGGVFTSLSEYVLSRGGLVIGAIMNKQTRKIEHIIIDNAEDLDKMRLSKYYQSEVGDIYLKVDEVLKEGRLVLFTGTGCQIAALYQICGNPDNLITAEVLCHGVTSKYIVDAYIKSQEKKFNKEIINYWFRVKDTVLGWVGGGGTRMKLKFADDSEYIADKTTDTFFSAFNENLILRESCYNCKFCGTNRIADFTLADFWGVSHERASEEQMKNGISLLLVNSDKARNILKNISNSLYIVAIEPNEAIPYNHALVAPNICHKKRKNFFSLIRKGKDYNFTVMMILSKKYIKNYLKNYALNILGEQRYKKFVSRVKSIYHIFK